MAAKTKPEEKKRNGWQNGDYKKAVNIILYALKKERKKHIFSYVI